MLELFNDLRMYFAAACTQRYQLHVTNKQNSQRFETTLYQIYKSPQLDIKIYNFVIFVYIYTFHFSVVKIRNVKNCLYFSTYESYYLILQLKNNHITYLMASKFVENLQESSCEMNTPRMSFAPNNFLCLPDKVKRIIWKLFFTVR